MSYDSTVLIRRDNHINMNNTHHININNPTKSSFYFNNKRENLHPNYTINNTKTYRTTLQSKPNNNNNNKKIVLKSKINNNNTKMDTLRNSKIKKTYSNKTNILPTKNKPRKLIMKNTSHQRNIIQSSPPTKRSYVIRKSKYYDELNSCMGLMNYLKISFKHYNEFSEPVDVVGLDIPDYHEIIKNPMDLGKKLSKK